MHLWNRSKRLHARGTIAFKQTFGVWNDEHYNARQEIGYSMKLIKECHPSDPTEWEAYYLQSGETAKEMRGAIPHIYPERTMKRMLREINVNYGKTYDQLKDIAKRFQKSLENNGITVTDDEAFNFVYIRAVDEAWIGYQRELAAEKALVEYCKEAGLTCRPTSANYDIRKGVDWEILKGEQVICGVQVKGSSYKKAVMDGSMMKDYDDNLKRQNREYTQTTGAPVFYLFVERNLQMENIEQLKEKVARRMKTMERPEEIAEEKTERKEPLKEEKNEEKRVEASRTAPHRKSVYDENIL